VRVEVGRVARQQLQAQELTAFPRREFGRVLLFLLPEWRRLYGLLMMLASKCHQRGASTIRGFMDLICAMLQAVQISFSRLHLFVRLSDCLLFGPDSSHGGTSRQQDKPSTIVLFILRSTANGKCLSNAPSFQSINTLIKINSQWFFDIQDAILLMLSNTALCMVPF